MTAHSWIWGGCLSSAAAYMALYLGAAIRIAVLRSRGERLPDLELLSANPSRTFQALGFIFSASPKDKTLMLMLIGMRACAVVLPVLFVTSLFLT